MRVVLKALQGQVDKAGKAFQAEGTAVQRQGRMEGSAPVAVAVAEGAWLPVPLGTTPTPEATSSAKIIRRIREAGGEGAGRELYLNSFTRAYCCLRGFA